MLSLRYKVLHAMLRIQRCYLLQLLGKDCAILESLCTKTNPGSAQNKFSVVNKFFHSSSTGNGYIHTILAEQSSPSIFAGIYKLLSSKAVKKGFENFVPKSILGNSAKAGAKKAAESSKSTGGSNKDGGNNNGRFDNGLILQWAGVAMLALYLYNFMGNGSNNNMRAHEISFQEFKTKLLAQGLVSSLEVVNHDAVRVYVRADSLVEGSTQGGVYRYFFQMGSVDSFERKLDDAQAELGLVSAERLSVKYVQEGNLMAAMVQLLPTLLLIGATYWMISRQMNQMGGMGGMGIWGDVGRMGKEVLEGSLAW
ncbi:hypothetical protein CEUSTIGMA_g3533.t1 [Chlamydomonas eustigma]|uniref:Peptidase M41 FtsH extracellular domain-containing protein n=1 Tax=Chlamydomonas eustigma TaxID=1157962 RepID=A0A250X007_9CHLO|nr:hypothetical protein CEUSTIGMA_g3533.t1 [Chlamydomonas eustigma]|eukprot:GAX76090.1 hypothetical protein CEUSTIGMA_g3533.t1 [Chlamydomonas eustigma]